MQTISTAAALQLHPDTPVDQQTPRIARKVQAASGGAAGGAAVGLVLAHLSFNLLPEAVQTAPSAPEAWAFVITSGLAYVGSLGLGYYIRERIGNMLIVEAPK